MEVKMSKDYVFHNKKLADALMEIASIPEDELSEKEYQVYANELRRVDSLLEDLGKALTKALDENEMLKGRILALAERIS
jgi:cell division septum initiation protein DivIVA